MANSAKRSRAPGRRRASHFCRHKSNQKGFQQRGFFAAQAFTLQSSQNHGLLNLTSTSFAHCPASARFANAPPNTQANMFCLLFA
ncbi:hypothetical protein [Mucilaginibacter aquaedulcis]|uniref:hypothetical protein n=1 Tax=Mucilaginibacter aquaedulcis TaxID=1187081 RepID=UPI0025B552C6|nr:hypothetical protein [Mucilaginibacter aquaedulcis]MDN3549688.1 hypothetical protein [Mucilaginibacter aquaedulcis]